jgi:hypothetical protein
MPALCCAMIYWMMGGTEGKLSANFFGPAKDTAFPQAAISNGIVHAVVYLPDTASGYYRGARFDWSGVIPELEYNGHSYAGQWFDKYAPTINDAIMGPVESFDPLDYEEAGAGGRFVAIGIGVLSRPDAAPYTPFRYYKLLNPGKWTVESGADRVEFGQVLNDTGYAYDYHKSLELVRGKAELVIRHVLKNTGKRTIETNVYDHNLWLLDRQPVGPGLAIRMPFAPSATQARRIGGVKANEGQGAGAGTVNNGQGAAASAGDARRDGIVAAIGDSQIVYVRKPAKWEDCYAVLGGYGESAKDYRFAIENHNTGAGLRVEGDRPLSKLVFWSSSTIACPEPYIRVAVKPGESFSWTLTYSFYEVPTGHTGSGAATGGTDK